MELIRHGDDVPVRRMLRTATANAQRLVRDGSPEAATDLLVLLDRVTTLAALALDLERPAEFALATGMLLELFDWGVTHRYAPAPGQLPAPQLWLRIAERLYALGALAVRLGRWSELRRLALAPVPTLDKETSGRSWHRHALTEASRSDLLATVSSDGRKQTLSLFARAVTAGNSSLHPDLPEVSGEHGGADPLLTSMCQFDFLTMIISGVQAGATNGQQLLRVSYPNYASADGGRVNAIVPSLIADEQMRSELLPSVSDEHLATVLRVADQIAAREGQSYWGWEGYQDPQVRALLGLSD